MPSPPSALLTPPETPNDELPSPFGETNISLSPVFRLDAQLDPSCVPDLIVISSDGMLFYVHSKILFCVSGNAFSGLLDTPPCWEFDLIIPAARVQSDSTVLDLVLHAIYGLDMAAGNPALALLSLAVAALLVQYSVPPLFVLSPGLPLFEAILAHAVVLPLQVYILAASYGLELLAVAASAHILSFRLALLSDEDVLAMGALYMRRLFFLHLGRIEALRRLVAVPPGAHASTAQCDAKTNQLKVQRAWTLATAAILLDSRADTSPQALEAALRPLLMHIWCHDCRSMLSDRTQKLVKEWSAIKSTI